MNKYREILNQSATRILLATLLFILGWYVIASATGGWGAITQLLFAMTCFVAGAIVIAPPIARLIAEPFGTLYYPDKHSDRPPPVYGIAEYKRLRGQYEEAISEYNKIAKEYPEEIKPYIEMIDIAVVNLQDRDRAKAIYKKGLSVLQKDEDREVLRVMYNTVTSKLIKNQ